MTTRRTRAADTPAVGAPHMLWITVHGVPKPKGSLRHVGKGHMVEQLEGSAPWRQTVAYTARQAAENNSWQLGHTGPVGVAVSLVFPKPKTAPKTRRTWPITRSSGDLDKLLRNIFDALVDAGIVADDSQIVAVNASKDYSHPHLDTPGARIHVWGMT